jgi:hypothetical protein
MVGIPKVQRVEANAGQQPHGDRPGTRVQVQPTGDSCGAHRQGGQQRGLGDPIQTLRPGQG